MPTTGKILSDLYKITVDGTEIDNLQNVSFEANVDNRDVTTKDSSGNREILPTTFSGTMSGEIVVALDAAYGVEELYDALAAKSEVTVVKTTGVSGDVQWSSAGYFSSVSIESPTQDNVTASFTVELTGETTKSDVP